MGASQSGGLTVVQGFGCGTADHREKERFVGLFEANDLRKPYADERSDPVSGQAAI
jgi:hypothetical protein